MQNHMQQIILILLHTHTHTYAHVDFSGHEHVIHRLRFHGLKHIKRFLVLKLRSLLFILYVEIALKKKL